MSGALGGEQVEADDAAADDKSSILGVEAEDGSAVSIAIPALSLGFSILVTLLGGGDIGGKVMIFGRTHQS